MPVQLGWLVGWLVGGGVLLLGLRRSHISFRKEDKGQGRVCPFQCPSHSPYAASLCSGNVTYPYLKEPADGTRSSSTEGQPRENRRH